ncbi:1-aminocyclopropane-1-carboxylate oxidase-1-like protein [Hordeum vulgare]|nr:1-aminocyclopropane-1-carboxylate oxidase-1-like protein [Hordeum vulgare]
MFESLTAKYYDTKYSSINAEEAERDNCNQTIQSFSAHDSSTTPAMSAAYDRKADLRALDSTCSGVRGLAASGITQLPRIFRVPDHHHESPPPQALTQESPSSAVNIPVIDSAAPTAPPSWLPSAGPQRNGDSSR